MADEDADLSDGNHFAADEASGLPPSAPRVPLAKEVERLLRASLGNGAP